ncbi:MAG: glycoside hydrolase family 5 protein [Bacteroidaceae bacterium]|nr:glycoside hydrolase family 5 protein [Bacteroidaceae bacterium]
MKRNFYGMLSLLLSTLALLSCGGDEPEDVKPDVLRETIVLRSASLAEGSEVDASSIKTITLSYNTRVAVNPEANITLNGQVVKAQGNSITSMAIDIPVSLESGTAYTLKVPSGSVLAVEDATQTAPALTLNFTTKKSGEQALPDNDAMALTRRLGFGWNLGNHFDSYDSNNAAGNYRITWSKTAPWWDGVNPTEDLYKNLAKAGVKTVRIPVTWGCYEDMNDGNYTIEPDYMALVRQNVLWAKAAGLNVVLNTHHDEYWQDAFAASANTSVNEATKARILATWTQIAEAFKDEGEYLILETFNELNHNWQSATSGEIRIMNEWNQFVVNAIRATGGQNATRWIAVPSYQSNPGLALRDDFKIPTDAAGKLIVAVHCYDPYNFTLGENLATTWGTAAEKKAITDLLNRLKEKFIDQNIPCYLGEFGCSRHRTDEENAYRAFYFEYFCRAAHFAGLSACLWDNNNPGGGSEHHAYFSHSDGSWLDESESLVKTMIKALTSRDESYTLESIVMK